MDMRQYLFKTQDKQYLLPYAIRNMSNYLTNINTDEFQITVPLLDFESEYLELFIEYCFFHKFDLPCEIEIPIQTDDFNTLKIDDWDKEFIQRIDFDKTINLLMIANKLECSSLENLCYAHLALNIRSNTINLLLDSSLNDLRQLFNLQMNEFTEADMMKVKTQNPNLMYVNMERKDDFN